MSNFEVGDKVFTCPDSKGVVVKKLSKDRTYPIRVQFDRGHFLNFTEDGRQWEGKEVTLKKLPKEEEDKFSVGQEVDTLKGNGKVVKISGDLILVRYQNGDLITDLTYTKERLEKAIKKKQEVDSTPDLQLGDKVTCDEHTGTVVSITEEEPDVVKVEWSDGEVTHCTLKGQTIPNGEVVVKKIIEDAVAQTIKEMKEEDFSEGDVVINPEGEYGIVNQYLEDGKVEVMFSDGCAHYQPEQLVKNEYRLPAKIGEEATLVLLVDEDENILNPAQLEDLWNYSRVKLLAKAEEHGNLEEGIEKFLNAVIGENEEKVKEEGVKFDAGKLRWTLLPWKATEKVVEVLEFGARKYSEDNWRKVPERYKRYRNAAMRHMVELMKGNEIDDESGMPHAAHAICCLMFMLEAGNDEA